jgi:RimJ/RimL family protein N-acetyltransferase
VSELLTYAFTDLGLSAVNAWTVEVNVAARRTLDRLGFKYIGRQRQCHYLDGRSYDRLLFDLLAGEHLAAVQEESVRR